MFYILKNICKLFFEFKLTAKIIKQYKKSPKEYEITAV